MTEEVSPEVLRQRQHNRSHYARNRQQYLDRNKARRKELHAMVQEMKRAPCMDCGVQHPPYVMDFDHRDPSKKEYEPNKLYLLGSKKKILEELAKCDLVCANCHRERTHKQRILQL